MKLDTPFYRLPLRFNLAELVREVSQFNESDWRAHPQGHPGNTAVPLIAVGGDPANDAVRGPMEPTPHLERCPYLRQVLASFRTVLGRTRLMRIVGYGEASPHVDTNYYWLHHIRVHVPAVTTPEVKFLCGAASVHMAAGECWVFDTWREHNVLNPADASRIHLVADTVGSPAFWDLLDGAERPFDPGAPEGLPARLIPFRSAEDPGLDLERFNFPVVLSPWEQECLIADLIEQLIAGHGQESEPVQEFQSLLVRYNRHWRALWARFADSEPGWPEYQKALTRLQAELAVRQGLLILSNGLDVVEALLQAIVRPALNPDLARSGSIAEGPPDPPTQTTMKEPASPTVHSLARPSFDRPVIIVAAPRSGSSLLFETLARSPDLWTVGGESHDLFESIPTLHPAHRGHESNRLTEAEATPEVASALRANFLARLRDRQGRPLPPDPGAFRLLEKTPKNALRIPFLNAVFPDARFVYLHRQPRENLSSILDAWRSGKFVTYPGLPGWQGLPWSLLLIPGWRELIGRPLEEIAASQWELTHQHILDDLSRLPRDRWTALSYEEFLADPRGTVGRLAEFANFLWDDPLDGPLPLSRHTLTVPDPEKWKRNAAELERVLPLVETIAGRVRAFTAGPVPATPVFAPPAPADLAAQSLQSVHTRNFPQLLQSLGCSLLVSTYQAGKVILVRADGGTLNTHFRPFLMPMGVAFGDGRLIIGGKTQVWEFRNQPEVARKLEPAGKHDACYLPRDCHWTGDIRVHEIAFAGDEPWIVNTRFSCLCTLDRDHSFVPRWRPPFVTALAPEDRCHLNGLGMRDGRVRYVTCLGATDTAGGWRENKRDGGLLLEVPAGEVLLRGLSMPHSPRWHQGRLWLLESGEGGIAWVDLKARKHHTVARLPGFTRGLDFHGHLAFIGLSQVRETATFGGLPLTERLQERTCGVWVVDVRDGKTVAFLRFESGVQEIFAVQVLPGIRFPELLDGDEDAVSNSFVLPDEALAEVPGLARPAARAG
jgi:uncharacterized protein (TIGR03032 family)